MDTIIKQHLLGGTRKELDEYFKDVVPVTDTTDFKGIESKFEIPTWTIRQQLDDIEKKDEPKTGFVWYFIRRVDNHPDGTFNIEMGLRQEMVWIKRGGPYEPYVMQVMNNLLQKTVNSNIMEQK